MKRLRVLPEASAEWLHEVRYYTQIDSALGERFHAAVRDCTERVMQRPEAGAPGEHQTRRRRVAGFPFHLVYRDSAHEVLMVALAPDRRRPGYWAQRS